MFTYTTGAQSASSSALFHCDVASNKSVYMLQNRQINNKLFIHGFFVSTLVLLVGIGVVVAVGLCPSQH